MTTTLNITGMNCGACAKNVTTALTNLPGVESVDVQLEAAKAIVTFDLEKVGTAEMIKAVEDDGYGASAA
ncbi:MAG: heavy-metal-associated domain-containing protein [Chthonomonadales bacterium]